ncbi:MAG: winged helix-turn-helix transcriptional regulator [Oscillospiraceae bacterium]|nr:winged helix-turn-helix transcriptional regulator [Oscillospiraceae bacterium]
MFNRYMNKRYHSSPDTGSGEGCGNVDCEYRDRCDRTGENCLRHGRGHEEGQPFDDPGPRFREGADGGHPCRICEYFYECDHSGKDCRRGPDGEGRGSGRRGHGKGRGSEGRGSHGHGDECGFEGRGPHGHGDERGFEGRGPHGHGDDRGFEGRGPYGHGERPGFEDDSLRSLLIRAAQSMHHPRAGASQELVLRILDREGAPDQQSLLRELRVRPGSLSELLGKLEQKGLIERERSESDRRRVIVRLTEAGRQALTPGETAADDPFAVLTGEEQTALRALLEKVLGLSGSEESEETE